MQTEPSGSEAFFRIPSEDMDVFRDASSFVPDDTDYDTELRPDLRLVPEVEIDEAQVPELGYISGSSDPMEYSNQLESYLTGLNNNLPVFIKEPATPTMERIMVRILNKVADSDQKPADFHYRHTFFNDFRLKSIKPTRDFQYIVKNSLPELENE